MALDTTPGSSTDRQITYIRDLANKKDLSSEHLNDEQREFLLGGNLDSLSKEQASKAIGLLLKLDDKPAEDEEPSIQDLVDHDSTRFPAASENQVESPLPVQAVANKEPPVPVSKDSTVEDKIEAGHYFIVDPTNNQEMFFKVDKPEPPSRWAGKTFLSVRASDTMYPVKDNARKLAVFEEILKDPITAMNEYGIRLGECGKCGRTLTNRDSRLRGLGPICAARIFGAPTDAQLELLSRLGLR